MNTVIKNLLLKINYLMFKIDKTSSIGLILNIFLQLNKQ